MESPSFTTPVSSPQTSPQCPQAPRPHRVRYVDQDVLNAVSRVLTYDLDEADE